MKKVAALFYLSNVIASLMVVLTLGVIRATAMAPFTKCCSRQKTQQPSKVTFEAKVFRSEKSVRINKLN
jgi:hypothetical protein